MNRLATMNTRQAMRATLTQFLVFVCFGLFLIGGKGVSNCWLIEGRY